MNKHRQKAKVMAMLLLMVGAVMFTVEACKSPQKTAYVGYATTRVGAQAIMAEWNAYLGAANPKPTADTERKVLKVYKAWQSSMALVADAGAVWSAAVNDPNAQQSKIEAALAAFNQAVSNAGQIESDLSNVVETITGKTLAPR